MNTAYPANLVTGLPAPLGQRAARLLASILQRSRSTRRARFSREFTPEGNLLPYDSEQGPGDLLIQCVRGRAAVDAYGDLSVDGRPLGARAARSAELRYAMTMAASRLL